MTEPLLPAPPPDEDIEDVPNDPVPDEPDIADAAAEAEFLRPIGGGL